MINFSKSKKNNSSLEITVSPACSKLCDYCPQTEYIGNYKKKFSNEDKFLTLNTLKEVSKNIPQSTIIKWTGFTEPLDCKEFDSSVQFLSEKGYRQQISTTLLGRENSQKYYLENLNKFFEHTLHLPDDIKLMKGKFDDKYKNYVEEVIKQLHKNKIEFSIFLIGENFHPIIQEMIKRLVKEFNLDDKVIIAKYLNTRASAIEPSKFGLKQTEKNFSNKNGYFCSYQRLNQGVLLPNGKVALCCQDYGLEAIIGDLKENNLDEIYNSIEKNQNSKKNFIEGNFSPCNRCEHYSPLEREKTSSREL